MSWQQPRGVPASGRDVASQCPPGGNAGSDRAGSPTLRSGVGVI